jgi:hypothetical protein
VTAVSLWAALGLAGEATDAGAPVRAPRTPIPGEAQCPPLGALLKPLPLRQGEVLDYDVDAVGARAGTLVMRTLAERPQGRWGVEVQVESNTFFSKVRRVKGSATSTLDAHTLRPLEYRETSTENEVHRGAVVTYGPAHAVTLVSTTDGRSATATYRWANDLSDVVGALPLLRSLPLKVGQTVCFDAYGVRRLWRVWGTVVTREHVSLPVGEFDAWHLAGEAARLDNLEVRREIHLWVSDDARRLPLAVVGSIDLGTVRATLKGWSRPSEKGGRAEPRSNLTW